MLVKNKNPLANETGSAGKGIITMYITCLDVEGVLVPEIWIAFAEASGIPELTTRDEPDYDKLMRWRLGILKEHGLGLKEIQATIEKIGSTAAQESSSTSCAPFSQVIPDQRHLHGVCRTADDSAIRPLFCNSWKSQTTRDHRL